MYIHLWLGRHDLTLNIPLEMSFFHQGYFLKPQTEQIQRLLISEVLNETPSFRLLRKSFPPPLYKIFLQVILILSNVNGSRALLVISGLGTTKISTLFTASTPSTFASQGYWSWASKVHLYHLTIGSPPFAGYPRIENIMGDFRIAEYGRIEIP